MKWIQSTVDTPTSGKQVFVTEDFPGYGRIGYWAKFVRNKFESYEGDIMIAPNVWWLAEDEPELAPSELVDAVEELWDIVKNEIDINHLKKNSWYGIEVKKAEVILSKYKTQSK